MFYDLSIPTEVKSAQSRLSFLIDNQKKISIVEKRRKRTYQQNRYLYLLIGFFSIETGYTLSESKQIYKLQSKDIYFYTKNNRPFVRSSADLNTAEMTQTIERFRNYASSEGGIYLPSPNEDIFLQNIENQLERYEIKVYI